MNTQLDPTTHISETEGRPDPFPKDKTFPERWNFAAIHPAEMNRSTTGSEGNSSSYPINNHPQVEGHPEPFPKLNTIPGGAGASGWYY